MIFEAIIVGLLFITVLAIVYMWRSIKSLKIFDFFEKAVDYLDDGEIDESHKPRKTAVPREQRPSQLIREIGEQAKANPQAQQAAAPMAQQAPAMQQQQPPQQAHPNQTNDGIPSSVPPNLPTETVLDPDNPYKTQEPQQQQPSPQQAKTKMNPLVEDDTLETPVIPQAQAQNQPQPPQNNP